MTRPTIRLESTPGRHSVRTGKCGGQADSVQLAFRSPSARRE